MKYISCGTSFLITMLVLYGSPAKAIGEDLTECVKEKTEKYRVNAAIPQTSTLTLDAPRGKLFKCTLLECLTLQEICETTTVSNTVQGNTLEDGQDYFGKPSCKKKSESLQGRSSITSCANVAGVPTMSAKASGKGCEEDNTAVFEMTYKVKPALPYGLQFEFYEACKNQAQVGMKN